MDSKPNLNISDNICDKALVVENEIEIWIKVKHEEAIRRLC